MPKHRLAARQDHESRKQARGKGMTLDLDQWFNSSITLSLVTGSKNRSINDDISSLERKSFDSNGSLSVVKCLRYGHSNDDISWQRASICHDAPQTLLTSSLFLCTYQQQLCSSHGGFTPARFPPLTRHTLTCWNQTCAQSVVEEKREGMTTKNSRFSFSLAIHSYHSTD